MLYYHRKERVYIACRIASIYKEVVKPVKSQLIRKPYIKPLTTLRMSPLRISSVSINRLNPALPNVAVTWSTVDFYTKKAAMTNAKYANMAPSRRVAAPFCDSVG